MRYFILAGFLFWSLHTDARVEYAVQHRMVSCTACHVNAFGGGPRTVDGKLYGSRRDEAIPWSYQDLWHLDARAIAYYPSGGTTSRQGSALMTTGVGVHLPVYKKPNGSEMRAIGVYSLGVVQQGPRDLFVQWKAPHTQTYTQVGRWNAPFGLPTDEHRTYTKLLTRTEIFDYEFGAAISGEWGDAVHYDFAISNGLVSGGQFNANSTAQPDATSAVFLNMRWMPAYGPFLLGLSASEHQRLAQYQNPLAGSLYGVLSLDRLTKGGIAGSILLEYVYAKNWSDPTINPNINRYFIPAGNLAYTETVDREPASAWFGQLDLPFARRWVAQYKYDRLTFQPQYGGDYFDRHGLGVKYFADTNLILSTRYEISRVGRAELKDQNLLGEQDAFWLLLQLWL